MYKKPDARQSICFVHKTYCVLDVPVAVAVVVLKGPFFLTRRRIILLRALTVAFCLSRPIKPCFYWVYPRTSLTVASIATVVSNKQLLFKTKEPCLKLSKIITLPRFVTPAKNVLVEAEKGQSSGMPSAGHASLHNILKYLISSNKRARSNERFS